MALTELEEKILDGFITAGRRVSKNIAEQKLGIVVRSREIMQNLSIVAGGLAAASLIALSSPLAQIKSLLVLGTVILLLEIVWIFCYLLFRSRVETDKVLELKREVLDPLNEIISLYFEKKEDKIDEHIFNARNLEIMEKLQASQKKGHSLENTNTDFKRDDSDRFFSFLLAAGVLSVALGLLLPYV